MFVVFSVLGLYETVINNRISYALHMNHVITKQLSEKGKNYNANNVASQ